MQKPARAVLTLWMEYSNPVVTAIRFDRFGIDPETALEVKQHLRYLQTVVPTSGPQFYPKE